MENELLFFKNELFEVEVRKDENDEFLFNAEMVAKNLGFKRVANSGNIVVRWDRVNKYLSSCPQVGTVKSGDYIPEYAVYKLAFKANNEIAEQFQDWLAIEVIPQIRKTGGYIPIEKEDSPELIMAKALKIAEKTIQEKEIIISKLEPKAQAYSELIDSNGLMSLKQVSNLIEIGRTKLCTLLRKEKVLSKQTGYNEPMGRFILNGYFETIIRTAPNKKTSVVTLVTPKGLNYIYKLINKNELLDEFDTSKLQEVSANV
jgi:anti-repressor protein